MILILKKKEKNLHFRSDQIKNTDEAPVSFGFLTNKMVNRVVKKLFCFMTCHLTDQEKSRCTIILSCLGNESKLSL